MGRPRSSSWTWEAEAAETNRRRERRLGSWENLMLLDDGGLLKESW